jgi:penicillin-binding protein 1C
MEIIYPERGARLFVPVQLDGTHGQVGLEAAHREQDAVLYWSLDGEHIASTRGEHRIAVDLPQGRHELTLTDQYGRFRSNTFTVERSKTPRQ